MVIFPSHSRVARQGSGAKPMIFLDPSGSRRLPVPESIDPGTICKKEAFGERADNSSKVNPIPMTIDLGKDRPFDRRGGGHTHRPEFNVTIAACVRGVNRGFPSLKVCVF